MHLFPSTPVDFVAQPLGAQNRRLSIAIARHELQK
jgi:hypothetical protein